MSFYVHNKSLYVFCQPRNEFFLDFFVVLRYYNVMEVIA
nr:MAG TPA: hypothetical protein [Caudoviricetes sp.]